MNMTNFISRGIIVTRLRVNVAGKVMIAQTISVSMPIVVSPKNVWKMPEAKINISSINVSFFT
jgi:hypothetical protein